MILKTANWEFMKSLPPSCGDYFSLKLMLNLIGRFLLEFLFWYKAYRATIMGITELRRCIVRTTYWGLLRIGSGHHGKKLHLLEGKKTSMKGTQGGAGFGFHARFKDLLSVAKTMHVWCQLPCRLSIVSIVTRSFPMAHQYVNAVKIC